MRKRDLHEGSGREGAAYEARGREFESLRAYHLFNNLTGMAGSGEYQFVPLQPSSSFLVSFRMALRLAGAPACV